MWLIYINNTREPFSASVIGLEFNKSLLSAIFPIPTVTTMQLNEIIRLLLCEGFLLKKAPHASAARNRGDYCFKHVLLQKVHSIPTTRSFIRRELAHTRTLARWRMVDCWHRNCTACIWRLLPISSKCTRAIWPAYERSLRTTSRPPPP